MNFDFELSRVDCMIKRLNIKIRGKGCIHKSQPTKTPSEENEMQILPVGSRSKICWGFESFGFMYFMISKYS